MGGFQPQIKPEPCCFSGAGFASVLPSLLRRPFLILVIYIIETVSLSLRFLPAGSTVLHFTDSSDLYDQLLAISICLKQLQPLCIEVRGSTGLMDSSLDLP